MAFHLNHAQFERARWRRSLLLPAWTVQIALLLGLLGIFSYRLAETIEHYEENDKKGKVPLVEFVWECTNVGFSVVSLVLTIMEVAKLFSETLTPFFLLASHIVKMTCAFANLALDIVVYTQRSEGNWSSIGLAIDVGLLSVMLALGIYSIVAFRRLSLYDDYQPTANVKAFGFGSRYDEIRAGDSGGAGGDGGIYNGDVFLRSAPYNDAPTSLPSQGDHDFSRSVASSSTPTPQPSTGAGDGHGIYNREHDRQFGQPSAALSKEDIDRAIGAELWGDAGSSHGAVERSKSVVGTGVVPSQTAVSASPHSYFNRTVSWTVEHESVSTPVSTTDGKSIATIVEETGHGADADDDDDEEAGTLTHGRYQTAGANEDRVLLLGHSREPSRDGDISDDDERDVTHQTPGPGPDGSHQGHMAS
ncbi:hypothetical protein SPI_06049 [Niveomyces insectorum RCEF 264]|uniref:Uncharacterized protein n=1 Tax=Niveomyces insectorum RCEF 264 TaxID=1081102 RepID=A0A167SR38_9HYPO|nr:hypothetical protein SPI_06049 [Niveomyces insectorum RCEF 264]